MQVYTKPDRQSIKTALFFLVLLFLAFLPVSSFLFFIKNDAFNGYFPPKFFMSEALRDGQLPIWNPYFNYGLPQYADMSASYWSPFTWLFAAIPGYNAYSFTFEILFYILLAGIGMYQLCRSWPMQYHTSLITGISYMCCGYITAHLQHFNWVTGAAFLPWCLWALREMQKEASWKNLLIAAIFFYLLFSSSHPGIIIGSAYFFSAWIIFEYFTRAGELNFKGFLKSHSILFLLIGILCAGMTISYAEIIPYITRGVKPTGLSSDVHPMSFQSWLSVLFPCSTVKNQSYFNTDLSMRNGYFGLTLLAFFLTGIFTRKRRAEKFLIITGLIFLLIAGGGSFKDFAYKFLPFVGYVRMSGEYAIFAQFSFILFASLQLEKFFNDSSYKKFQKILKLILLIALVVLAFSLIRIAFYGESIFSQLPNLDAGSTLREKLKFFIDNLSFYDCLFIQSIIQSVFLLLLIGASQKQNLIAFLRITVADMILATLLNIGFTGAGQASVADVQRVLDKSPAGIPVPDLGDSLKTTRLTEFESGLVGNWSFYDKQIGPSVYVFYPVEFKTTRSMYADSSSLSKPWIYSSAGSKVSIKEYRNDHISLEINSAISDTVRIRQNYYPNWVYDAGDGWKNAIRADNYFIGAPLKAGINNVIFKFQSLRTKAFLLITLITLLGYSIAIVWIILKNKSSKPIAKGFKHVFPSLRQK